RGQPTAWTSKSEPMPLRDAGSSSMAFIKKTGNSISRTPQIVSETSTGKRNLVSKHGIMTEREMKKTSSKVPSAPSQSVANRRG
ncbi:MAG TPA: hypothetical protein VK961_19090, partial [Chthoniobacter sp.]|nr:hypothetical protein [Chthoniobacter sp.]